MSKPTNVEDPAVDPYVLDPVAMLGEAQGRLRAISVLIDEIWDGKDKDGHLLSVVMDILDKTRENCQRSLDKFHKEAEGGAR